MKKIFLTLVFLIATFSFDWLNAYFYNEYYSTSITKFINSPSKVDLENIENNRIRNCERVYLEATRRREYTEIEKKLCSDIFQIKRQEELDYMYYMFRNRGIY